MHDSDGDVLIQCTHKGVKVDSSIMSTAAAVDGSARKKRKRLVAALSFVLVLVRSPYKIALDYFR
jgi:hypothetical protein